MAIETPAPPAADVLDGDVRRFVDEIGTAFSRFPALDSLTPPEARRVAEKVRAPWRKGGPAMREVTEHHVPVPGGGLRIRRYAPEAPGMRPALIYLHGGGWTFFSLDTHDRVMREYAARAGVVVIGVDYPLSPETKFPVALEQIVALVKWLTDGTALRDVDSGRMAIGGDSAGANLAVATCLMLRDTGGPQMKGMLLSYGAFDVHSSDEAARRFGGPGFPLSHEEMQGFWRNYLRAPDDARNPLACPLGAKLDGLPPAFMTIPECDLLTEQNLAMADRLRTAGVSVSDRLYEGASHSFLEAVSIAAIADRALADGSAWLRATLSR